MQLLLNVSKFTVCQSCSGKGDQRFEFRAENCKGDIMHQLNSFCSCFGANTPRYTHRTSTKMHKSGCWWCRSPRQWQSELGTQGNSVYFVLHVKFDFSPPGWARSEGVCRNCDVWLPLDDVCWFAVINLNVNPLQLYGCWLHATVWSWNLVQWHVNGGVCNEFAKSHINGLQLIYLTHYLRPIASCTRTL